MKRDVVAPMANSLPVICLAGQVILKIPKFFSCHIFELLLLACPYKLLRRTAGKHDLDVWCGLLDPGR